MNYKMILEHMKTTKTWPYWQFGAPWFRMAYDEKTGNLYLACRDRQTKTCTAVKEAGFIITPKNTMIIPEGDVSSTLLGTLGIAGRFRTMHSKVARDYYQLNCMVNYEAYPNFEIDFSTGVPIGARKIAELRLDPQQAAIVDAKIEALRAPLHTLVRMRSVNLSSESYWQAQNLHWTRSVSKRDAVLKAAITRKTSHWSENVIACLHYFASTAKAVKWNDPQPFDSVFDRMVRFHESALYRHFDAIR
jgi:hypothetical protein